MRKILGLAGAAAVVSALLLALPQDGIARSYANRVTFKNNSREPALVKVVGRISRRVSVPGRRSRSVTLPGGRFRVLIRFGQPGSYRYLRGDSFYLERSDYLASNVVITFDSGYGNYGTEAISAGEFGR